MNRRCFHSKLIRLLALLWLVATTGLGAAANDPITPPRQALLFRNGDLLYGSLLSIEPATGVQWQHPDAAEPIVFSAANLTEIQLGHPPVRAAKAPYRCLVRLANLDELEGSVLTLDASELTLDTWYAGRLRIPRARVLSIIPRPEISNLVYEGPTGLEGWTMGKVNVAVGQTGEWRYRNGAFYATEAASIARDLKLPPMSTLEFDMAWRGSLNVAVALYTDYLQPVSLRAKEQEPDFGGFYSLQMNSQYVSMLLVKKLDPLKHLGQAIVPSFQHKNSAHIAIKSSRQPAAIYLLVDGALIKQWIDPEGFGGVGTSIRLVHQGQGSIKLSNLRVTGWDGRFEETPPPNPNQAADFALLLNRDKVSGTLQRIQAGKATFAATGTTLDIPLQRVMQIELARDKSPREPGQPGAIRVYFAGQGSLTFDLERWDNQRVTATSPNFGRAQFDPRAFSRIEFHVNR